MRFLANENFPGAAVAILKSAGHDVICQAASELVVPAVANRRAGIISR
jgi:hypothetical protein